MKRANTIKPARIIYFVPRSQISRSVFYEMIKPAFFDKHITISKENVFKMDFRKANVIIDMSTITDKEVGWLKYLCCVHRSLECDMVILGKIRKTNPLVKQFADWQYYI